MSTPNPIPPGVIATESKVLTFVKKWGLVIVAAIVGIIVGHLL